jgi:hypothetical protein
VEGGEAVGGGAHGDDLCQEIACVRLVFTMSRSRSAFAIRSSFQFDLRAECESRLPRRVENRWSMESRSRVLTVPY